MLAEKYADKVAPEHVSAMDTVATVRLLLVIHREQLQKVADAEERMHSIGGMLDPTLYRDMLYSKSWALQLTFIRAALAFLKDTDEAAASLVKEHQAAAVALGG